MVQTYACMKKCWYVSDLEARSLNLRAPFPKKFAAWEWVIAWEWNNVTCTALYKWQCMVCCSLVLRPLPPHLKVGREGPGYEAWSVDNVMLCGLLTMCDVLKSFHYKLWPKQTIPHCIRALGISNYNTTYSNYNTTYIGEPLSTIT
jgi:hypothetical protein